MSISDKLAALFRSRRFWAAFAGVLVTVTDVFGLGLSPEQVQSFVLVVAAWIVGDSLNKTN